MPKGYTRGAWAGDEMGTYAPVESSTGACTGFPQCSGALVQGGLCIKNYSPFYVVHKAVRKSASAGLDC